MIHRIVARLAGRQAGGDCAPRASRPGESYEPGTAVVKTPTREHYPNLSPTRPPVTPADVALWPDWTKLSISDLDLDDFDDDGHPIPTEGGWCS